MNISVTVLIIILILIAIPKTGYFRLKIWQLMLVGASILVLSGEISWQSAITAIDVEVMLFLFGMFVIGQAMVASGYLYFWAYRLTSRLHSLEQLLVVILFGAGLSAALLMNDTLAIIGTPLVLRLGKEHRINPSMLLLTLAYSITIGSVMSPLGNPQNFLITSHSHLSQPFQTFLSALGIPTLINLALTFGLMRWMYAKEFSKAMPLVHTPVVMLDKNLARCAHASLILLLALIAVKIWLVSKHSTVSLSLSQIALISALPPLLFSSARGQIIKHLDWSTLMFFAAMFIVMASIWQTGLLQAQIHASNVNLTSISAIMVISSSLSQLISNVPLVALYLPMLGDVNTQALMALAAGSTVAGNFLILGAASNVIIIQQAENHGATLSLYEFARTGIPLGMINLLVYWLWLNYWYN